MTVATADQPTAATAGRPSAGRPSAAPVVAAEVVVERVGALRQRVAELSGGRPVTIVAVTKGFGPDAAAAALAAGLGDLGESYAQELVAKAEAAAAGGGSARWHHLGAVQRRKVRALAPVVHLWQSVDRPAAGREIARHAPGASVLAQVNVTAAPGRTGCSWEDAPALVDQLRELGLHVRGLMAVAGRDGARAQFRRLALLARDLELPELSMGMSGDIDDALQEGSTMIRVGRALFGPRPVHDPDGRRR